MVMKLAYTIGFSRIIKKIIIPITKKPHVCPINANGKKYKGLIFPIEFLTKKNIAVQIRN